MSSRSTPTLAELQRRMRAALLEGDEEGLLPHLAARGIAAETRLAVHRNNVVASLTAVLADVFPAVRRLVDERFFAYAAHAFLTGHPPEAARLACYGQGFPDFLADFPPSSELVYLADVARLEWLMHWAGHAPQAKALEPQSLSAIPAEATPRLAFGLIPSLGLIASPWPIDRIWRANRAGGESGETIDLASGAAHLEVRRRANEVVMRSLAPPAFAFRRALASNKTLAAATEEALARDACFDLAAELAALFREGAVASFALAPAISPREPDALG